MYKRPRNRNHEGARKYVNVQVPIEVYEDLKLYKDLYSVYLTKKNDERGNPVPIKVTFEQMFRRWMESVRRFDPEVARSFVTSKQSRDRARKKEKELADEAKNKITK